MAADPSDLAPTSSPKDVVRFFIESIQHDAARLDPETMPYDFAWLARVADEVAKLAAWGAGPLRKGVKNDG
jgi:hypothetical protein